MDSAFVSIIVASTKKLLKKFMRETVETRIGEKKYHSP